jgi:predicted AlkP superfamily phosphohydrolase/phosphomutase
MQMYIRASLLLLSFLLFVSTPFTAYGYIGPGAGFAVVSSFFVLFLTGIIALFAIVLWPFRATLLYFRRLRNLKNRKVKRAVVVGLDGLDPDLVNQYMKKGMLPNFQNLKESGSFRALRTTTPSISPVAWSTFATGVNPGKHSIFDFYTRDPNNYSPVLSSVRISSRTKKYGIGPVRIPFRRTNIRFLRKSTSFWKILSKSGVFCSILRVPITFPPEKFYGTCLSAMCTPDLRGTQGSFTCFTTDGNAAPTSSGMEGTFLPITLTDNRFRSEIPGPSTGTHGKGQHLALPLEGEVDAHRRVMLKVNGSRLSLTKGTFSPWVKVKFKAGLRKRISGIVRFLVTETQPDLKIYMTPINIDPESPALPISHPIYHSISLSKLYGSFATLGLAEDTWALNERVLDETAFLEQAYDIYEERKRHLMDAIEKNREGLVVTVFDTTDRIQHMFFRYLDTDHPSNTDKDIREYKDTIKELYRKADELVGEVLDKLSDDDLLMIVSDHGFKSFKWGVNLNTWLWQEGYLVLKHDAPPYGEWFAGVDWPRTRAYAYGLAGIFLNIKGREKYGIVDPGKERVVLQNELKARLEALSDERNGQFPIRNVYLSQEVLKGPYVKDAPDLFVGYASGYRASWNSAIGKITDAIIEENTKSWSGDHAIDPGLVPGVFFSNWKMEDDSPGLTDLAPTILSLFGVEKQTFHDGRVLNLKPPQILGQEADKI